LLSTRTTEHDMYIVRHAGVETLTPTMDHLSSVIAVTLLDQTERHATITYKCRESPASRRTPAQRGIKLHTVDQRTTALGLDPEYWQPNVRRAQRSEQEIGSKTAL
jgi:hypothetical protein